MCIHVKLQWKIKDEDFLVELNFLYVCLKFSEMQGRDVGVGFCTVSLVFHTPVWNSSFFSVGLCVRILIVLVLWVGGGNISFRAFCTVCLITI